MANITLTVDDDVLRRARIRALEHGTSVNAVVRGYLEDYAGRTTTRDAIQSFLSRTQRAERGSGAGGRAWTRDDAYEDRVG